MESEPRRRDSMALPPELSELMNKLIEYANAFIKEFDRKQSKMREIVGEFQKIVDDVKKMQEETDAVRTTGVVTRRIGKGLIGLGLLAAPFTGGASLAATAAGVVLGGAAAASAKAGVAAAAVAAAVAAKVGEAKIGVAASVAAAAVAAGVALGGAGFVSAIRKKMKEDRSAGKVKKLGKEFMQIIEPLKNDLEEIKTTCEKLEEKSVEVQAENTLRDTEEFQRILGQISELGRRDSIIQSADQCQTVVDQFDQMRKELKDFKETKEKHKLQREEKTSFTLKHGD